MTKEDKKLRMVKEGEGGGDSWTVAEDFATVLKRLNDWY